MKSKYKTYAMALMAMGWFFICGCAATKTSPAVETLADSIINTIEIKAAPEKVFNFLAEPRSMTAYFPNMKSVTNVQGRGLGATFDWTLDIQGKIVNGQAVYADYIPNQKLVLTTSLPNATVLESWIFLITPTASGGTRLTAVMQSVAENPVMSPSDRQAVARSFRQEVRTVLNNIKTEVEK
jgi:uncharacterized protein YndB with AHSA1/START domain